MSSLRIWSLALAFTATVGSPLARLFAQSPGSALKAAPSADRNLVKAQTLIEQGRYDEAIEELRQQQSSNATIKGTYHYLGLAYYKQADFLHAQSEFARAISEDANDREAVQFRGISLYQIGRPEEAIPLLQQVQSWAPEASVEASYILALCYIQTRNYEDARKEAARMYDIPSGSAASYLLTARMLLRQGHDPIAEQYAQKAAAADPKLPLVHFLLGEFYLYKSDIARAAAEFEKELQLNPAFAGTYDRLADVDIRTGKYDEAERLLRRGIFLDSNATGPFILMGKVQMKKNDFSQAALYLEKAAKMDPNNFMTHHLLGDAYRGAGKIQDAERELRLAEQLQSAEHPKFETPK